MSAWREIGDSLDLTWLVEVDEVATNATVALTVTLPDGTTTTPAVSNPSTGNYAASFTATQSGEHTARWVATGAVTQAETVTFYIGGISLDEVKAASNITLTGDDDELQTRINRALRRYARKVRPLPGTYADQPFNGGGSSIVLPEGVTAVTAASYTDGTTIDVDDLSLNTSTGILKWGYNTAGYFAAGDENVLLTYTVGPIPEDDLDVIIADVVGLFQHTQRTTTVDDQGFTQAYDSPGGTAVNLWPRIDALGRERNVGIA